MMKLTGYDISNGIGQFFRYGDGVCEKPGTHCASSGGT